MKRKVSDVSYRQAVEIIKSEIDSSENLSEKDRGNIAESLLEIENPQSSGQLEGISLSFGPEQRDRLEAYLGQLEDVRQSNIDQEVREAIERSKRLSDLRNELKTRIHSAMDEARELEQIANKLQDDNLGNIAGKEEREIKQLGEELQQIDSKAEEVEELEQKISSLLGRLGEKSLKEHLEIKERAVSQILQESSTNNGSTVSAQLNQIVSNMQDKLPKLRKAKNRGLQELEDDIKTLSSMVELEEQEIGSLEKVEKHLDSGNLDFVETGMRMARDDDILDELVDRREEFGQNSKHIKEIRKDIKKEKELIKALSSFFHSLETLNQKSIPRNKLYNNMASEGAFSTAQNAKSFVENIENEFNQIKEDIKDVERLEGKERELENIEHEKIREIDKKSSELWQNAQNAGERKRLKKILKTLKKLDFKVNRQVEQVIEFKNEKHIGDWFKNYNKASTGEIRDWKPVIAHPEDHLNVRDEIKSLSDNEITYYDISNESSFFSYPVNYPDYKTPEQGFKFHVTAYPHEAYEVCKELIPILQKLGVAHKVMTDISKMAQKMNKSGSFREVQGMKLFTIYPGFYENDPKEQIFKPGDINNNEKYFFSNQSHTEYVMEKILELADDSIIQGGPELKGKRNKYDGIDVKEYRVKNTGLHLTYSFIGGSRSMEVNGNEISIEKWVREKNNNGDWQSRGNFREAGTFDKNSNYSSSDYFLSHLLQKKDSRRVKKHLIEGDEDPDKAIIGLDGKIAGAYYLPPPEAVQRIKQIISSV